MCFSAPVKAMEDSRLASLIDLFVAGVLSTDEEAELYHTLVLSVAAREQFDRQIASHRAQQAGVDLPDALEAIQRWETPPEELAGEPVPPLLAVASTKLRAWCGAAATAVLIGTGLVIFLNHVPELIPLFQPPATATAEGEVLATLGNAVGVAWIERTNETFVGDTFPAGRLQIAAGAMQLDFKRGAHLVVEGPADVQLVSDNEAFLRFGKVTAHVPDEAHGFKITSPAVAVVDLGTEFGLRVATNEPPEVHVFTGLVEMARPEKQPEQMKQGQAARIKGTRVRRFSSERRAFLFEDEIAQRAVEEQGARYRTWKAAAEKLSSDPATLIHYTFEDQTEGARAVLNCGGRDPKNLAAGEIKGCQWTDGRWPEKRALAFTEKTDRVRFTVTNTLTSMTYMVWLRVDRLLNTSNALALTDTMQQGELHWQIYRDGRVAMSSRSGSGSTVEQTWDRGISSPIFTADRLGKWTLLVSVYDSSARTISHYVNGEFVSASPMKRPIKLKLGTVELGNWGVRVDQSKSYLPAYVTRNLNGRIDEFALLARAMTPDEIHDYYQQGRIAAGVLVAKRTGP
jgi:hypothetical protein